MSKITLPLGLLAASFGIALFVFVPRTRAADSLPAQIADDAFWKLIESSSEPGGVFQSENFLSNENGFQAVIPRLQKSIPVGGVYMGVGPEQNFTYIAAIHPKIAFIIDIRHQNLLEHMIYKALFELSTDRADFVSRLFSRKRPAGLTAKSTATELFNAFATSPIDEAAYKKNLSDIQDVLLKKHKFALTAQDISDMEHVYSVFREFGPSIDYTSGSASRGFGGRGFGGRMPSYLDLMTATDLAGTARSYLASEDGYRFVHDMEAKNLIIPLTGDFGGPKAIRTVGQYAKSHGATIAAFYLSNVEQYLFQGNGNQNGGWKNFYESVATLPLDSTSTFIRSVGGGGRGGGGGFPGGTPGGFRRGGGGMRSPNVLSSIQETVAAVKSGRVQGYSDILAMSK